MKVDRTRKWTQEEIDKLIELFPDHTTIEIAKVIDRSLGAIRSKGLSMGLRKTDEWLSERARNNKISRANLVGNFPFPAGSERVNVNGTISIKTPNGEWMLKHHYVYTQTHGTIPDGHIIKFKDGNPKNCDISNLKLITRKELIELNRDWEKGTKTLNETLRRERLLLRYGLKQNTKRKLVNIY